MSEEQRKVGDFTLYEAFIDTSKQFRVVTIQPGQYNDPISCTLETHYLDIAPEYMALSYCWGDEGDAIVIKLQGTDWLVTKNLYAALNRIRQEDKAVPLWIDAICINQRSISDKNHQIPLMGEIYKSAVAVIAWLGDDCVRSSEAFEIISEFSDLVAHMILDEFSPKLADELQFILMNDGCIWDCVFDIFKQPYWHRVWIIQELCLAQDVHYMWDTAVISQDDLIFFLDSISHLVQYGEKNHMLIDVNDPVCKELIYIKAGYATSIIRFAKKFQDFQNPAVEGDALEEDSTNSLTLSRKSEEVETPEASPDWASFLYLLRRTRASICKDPRDKIYALLGLTNFHPLDGRLPIVPDHNKSVFEVYRDFTYAHILNTNSLDILERAGLQRRSRTDINSSWVPDFTFNYSKTKHDILLWNSCGTWKANPRICSSGRLHSEALICDSINSICAIEGYFYGFAQLDSIHDHLVDDFLGNLELLIAFISENMLSVSRDRKAIYFASSAPILEILFHLLLSKTRRSNAPVDTGTSVGLCLLLGALTAQHVGDALPKSYNSNSYLDSYFLWAEGPQSFIVASDEDKWKAFECALPNLHPIDHWPKVGEYQPKECIKQFLRKNALNQPRVHAFFRTQHRFFGYSGTLINKSDKVCILPGGRNPFVLRQVGSAYQLIDYCFIYGMMDGEMVDSHNKNIISLTSIEIE